ncbi:MAG: SDR family oxidoreductase [Gemmatimonadota bacterium]|nr:MAG: SDR family oxidoreductase [Gemmatimonadota bacterium]
MADLQGKVAVVTGGSKGIGHAIARALCGAGADVTLCSRDESEAAGAAAELGSRGGRALGIAADVRKLEDVEHLVAATVREFGGLDILIANAGVGGGFGPVDEIEPEVWHRVIDTNLTGVYHCCHEAVPELKRRGGGWIITIASLAGRYAFAGGTAYNASKFGLLGFTEALMLDLRDHGIRVSCIMPGTVDTYFDAKQPTGESWKLAPDDVARTVLQLLAHEDRALPSRVELRPSQPQRK